MNKNNPSFIAVVSILVAIALVPAFLFPSASAAITTEPPIVLINTTKWCVIFNGTNTGAAENVWFEYGNNLSGGFSFKTENQTKAGLFNHTQCGFPFLPRNGYYIKAVGQSGHGANVSVIFPAVTPQPTLTYSQYVDRFINAYDNPRELIVVTWVPYTAIMGGIFFGVLMAAVFWNMAIKQRTIALSILVLMITGGSMWGLFPDYPEFVWVAQTLFIAGMVGMIYWMFTRRR
jgi:hypothetical protein